MKAPYYLHVKATPTPQKQLAQRYKLHNIYNFYFIKNGVTQHYG